MTAERANSIDLDKETNVETLRELVRFWQELAENAEKRVKELQPSASSELIKTKGNQEQNSQE